MSDYKCGHDAQPVIMDSNSLSLAFYLVWKDTVGFNGDKSMCFPCYCEEDRKRIEKDKKQHPENWEIIE